MFRHIYATGSNFQTKLVTFFTEEALSSISIVSYVSYSCLSIMIPWSKSGYVSTYIPTLSWNTFLAFQDRSLGGLVTHPTGEWCSDFWFKHQIWTQGTQRGPTYLIDQRELNLYWATVVKMCCVTLVVNWWLVNDWAVSSWYHLSG